MDSSELIETYPRLFHMAEIGSWESIERNGLLSTEALLDLFDVKGDLRNEILETRRSQSYTITHPIHGSAVIRDQLVLHAERLSACLTDMTLGAWLRMLNSRVFFWATEERLEGLLSGKMYRERSHEVLIVDTEALVTAYADRITLCPINSGATIYNARPRGSDTFQSISDYPFEQRRKARGRKNAVAEVAVEYAVQPAREVVERVEQRRGATIHKVIWEGSDRPRG